jgi:hypothetical protein
MNDDKRRGPEPGKRRGSYENPNKAPDTKREQQTERREKGTPGSPGRKPGGKNKREPGKLLTLQSW